MKRLFLMVAMLAALVSLAGCATSSPPVALTPAVVYHKPASLDFILVTTTNTLPDVQTETEQLQDRLLSGLRETDLFQDVELSDTNRIARAGIKIQATIKQITKVSANSRQWFGGFAGRAQVVVQVKVSDLVSGKLIEVFEVEGKTGASAWAGTTNEAINRAAVEVIDEIKRLDSLSAQ